MGLMGVFYLEKVVAFPELANFVRRSSLLCETHEMLVLKLNRTQLRINVKRC